MSRRAAKIKIVEHMRRDAVAWSSKPLSAWPATILACEVAVALNRCEYVLMEPLARHHEGLPVTAEDMRVFLRMHYLYLAHKPFADEPPEGFSKGGTVDVRDLPLTEFSPYSKPKPLNIVDDRLPEGPTGPTGIGGTTGAPVTDYPPHARGDDYRLLFALVNELATTPTSSERTSHQPAPELWRDNVIRNARATITRLHASPVKPLNDGCPGATGPISRIGPRSPAFDVGYGRITIGDMVRHSITGADAKVVDIAQDGEVTIAFMNGGHAMTVKWRHVRLLTRSRPSMFEG